MNTIITSTLVPEAHRVAVAARLFGTHFPMRLEPTVFNMASMLSSQYDGGFWEFHQLGNGGFYMAPQVQNGQSFEVTAENGFVGVLSAEAFGIASCMYAYSHLSFGEGAFAEACGEHYHRLRDLALAHAESAAILGACD